MTNQMNNNLINIKPYPKPKKEGGGSANITYNISGTDIKGGDLNVKSLTANRIAAEYIEANNLEATNGKFVYLVASDGTISTLRGNDLTYDVANIGNLKANDIETQKLNVTDTATIENIFNNYLNSKEIVTDYLTVNKSAHFFEVIIDKIKSVGGTIINTATSCVLDYVIPYNASGPTTFDEDPNLITKYRCYWKRYANENSQNKKDEVSNDWEINDQAISQNCNLVSGVNHDAGNHYYWRLVINKDNGPEYVNFDTGEVWGGQGTPEYQITFEYTGIDENEEEFTLSGFTYDNGEENTEAQPNAHVEITDWQFTPMSGIENDWDGDDNKFTVRDTINGLQIMPIPISSVEDIEQAPLIKNGTFTFGTEYPTRLNVFIFYDDETVEYHPAPTVAQNIYQISLASVTGAIATRFVVSSAEVNVWHLCNWIELGNGQGEVDAPTHLTGTFDDAPRIGDNVVQLGFRYQNLTNPTQDDIARSSAIIIASFKTPDSGGTINGNVIDPIVPPSYAQYQNITDFNLYTHRGTYMDANGAHFKGTLEAGSTIDGDVVNVTTKMWKLVPDKDPIIKGDTIQFTIFYSENGEGRAITSLDTGWYLMVYTKTPQGWQNGQTFNSLSVTTTSETEALKVELWDGSGTGNILRDVFQATTIDLSDITDGIDGAYDQWAYKNAASGPQAPISNSTYPPTGWQAQPTTPSEGEHTWMTTRTVTPRSSSQINYGNWSEPIRITGDDGKPGTDGKYTEFIYRRFKEPPTWTTNNLNPNNWDVNSNPDYLGIAYQTNNSDSPNNKWTDNPRGVNDTYKYEYVSSRSYDGTTFTKFDVDTQQPSLWSKYGENGMDGDGVEYIFTSYHGASLPTTGYPGYDNNIITIDGQQKTITFTEDDFYPAGWSDDPMSPTESNPYIFVSQRKQINGEWIKPTSTITGTPWSEPAIWARWSKDGKDGTNGQNGTDGNDGDTDILAPVSERFIVTISLNNYNNATEVWTSDYYTQVKSALECDLQYKINKKVGNDYAVMTATDISNAGYTLKFRLNMTSGATYTDNFTLDNNIFKFPTATSYKSNLLNWLYTKQPSNNKTSKNYEKDAMEGKDTPVSCDVLLYKNGVEVMVAKHYDVIFDTGDIFRHDKYAFNSILFGTYTYVDSQGNTVTINSMSSIHQTMKEISTRVQGITYNSTTGETTIDGSTIQQLSDSITASVSQSVLNTVDGRGYQTSSQVQLTAESISAAVQTDIEGKLKRTGIDISNGLINIASDNTTIGGNVYIHGGALKSNGLISSVDVSAYCTWTGKVNTTTSNYAFTTNKTTIGTFTAGDKITVTNLYKNLIQTDLRGQQSDQTPLLGKVTYKIYSDYSTLFTSFTSKPSSALSITTGGTYYLEVTSSATLTGSYGYTFNGGLAMTLVKNTVVEMADNGINLAVADSSSNRHYMRFSPDTIESAIFEVGTYATENGSQHFPLGGLRIANGMPQQRIANQTYGNTTSLPKYYRVESAGLWGSLGSQLAVKKCTTASEEPVPQVDFYIYADKQPSNAVFDLTVTDHEIRCGLYTGRIIRIKGFNGLVIKCPTKIIRKNQDYGNDTKSQQIKMGGNSNSNFNPVIGTQIEYYSLTLILVGTIWYEI